MGYNTQVTGRILYTLLWFSLSAKIASCQAPPEELLNLRQVLGVTEETKLLGPNAVQLSTLPNNRPIRVYIAVGFDTTVNGNLMRALNQANERPAESYAKEARKQKKEKLEQQTRDKPERQRLLQQWQASYRAPHFQMVPKIEEADVVLARYVLVHSATQKIESHPEQTTVWTNPYELSRKDAQEHPLGRADKKVVQKTESRTVMPAFDYIFRVQDGGQSLVLIHRNQDESPLQADSSTGIQLVHDLIQFANSQ